MTITFMQIWEQMDRDQEKQQITPLMDSGQETKQMGIIRTGNGLHKEGERSFWDEFMDLCANREGLAELLNINSEKISSWPERIRKAMEDTERHDAESASPAKELNKEVIPSGDTGAVTTPGNADPYLGELQ